MTPSRPEVATPLTDFARLYHEHAADVHRFAVYLSGSPPLADDLVSEAFMRVWTARELLMRANGELPYEEIAAALGISVNAAKVKVHRARLRLGEALGR